MTGVVPVARLGAGLGQHPLTDRQDQAGFLGERNKFRRWYQAPVGMLPADECLGAPDLAGHDVHLWLIVQQELATLERMPQAGFEGQTALGACVHLGGIEAKAVAAMVFGVEHGGVGIAQQLVAGVIVERKEGDTDARRYEQFASTDDDGGRQPSEHLVRHPGDVVDVRNVGQHNHKLVTAVARHGVARPDRLAQPSRHDLEQFVAAVVSERIVDDLEAVEIYEQHSDQAFAVFRLLDRLAQALTEQHAIRQVGERVVVGEVHEPCLGMLACGDVLDNGHEYRRVFSAGQLQAHLHRVERTVLTAMHSFKRNHFLDAITQWLDEGGELFARHARVEVNRRHVEQLIHAVAEIGERALAHLHEVQRLCVKDVDFIRRVFEDAAESR